MPKPPRIDVMVSSTLRDLKDHRAAARDAILQARMFPLRMEEAGAQTGTTAVRFSRDLVRDADVYVGIFAYHYGYVPDDEDQSVTEIEYRAWSERLEKDGMPGFLFLQDPDHPFP
ncbi:MAG: DUF4062 domain-containing protein, partial [bacterium]|nr:DUF4062 domain-containing protein [bacterium]